MLECIEIVFDFSDRESGKTLAPGESIRKTLVARLREAIESCGMEVAVESKQSESLITLSVGWKARRIVEGSRRMWWPRSSDAGRIP